MNGARFLRAVSIPYGWGVTARARLFEWGWLRQHRLPVPVISVGNLTVGGTGKTPVIIWLAQWLTGLGRCVGILSRGYRRANRARCLLVSDGKTIHANPTEVGDEPYLIAQRCPGTIVAVGADRFQLGQWLLGQFPVDCVLLDDGFQHRALRRDGDLVLVDASDPEGLEDLIPVGRLREPLAGAARATAIILTRADESAAASTVISALERSTRQTIAPIVSRFEIPDMWGLPKGDALQSTASIHGRRVFLSCGIGNPRSFQKLVEGLSCRIHGMLTFPDHHRYTGSDVAMIRRRAGEVGAEMVLTTEKDAVKLAPLVEPDEGFWAVRATLRIVEGEERLKRLIENLLRDRPVTGTASNSVHHPQADHA